MVCHLDHSDGGRPSTVGDFRTARGLLQNGLAAKGCAKCDDSRTTSLDHSMAVMLGKIPESWNAWEWSKSCHGRPGTGAWSWSWPWLWMAIIMALGP